MHNKIHYYENINGDSLSTKQTMYTNLMKKYEKSTYEHNYDIKFKQKQLREKESMEEKETWVGSYPKQRAKKTR